MRRISPNQIAKRMAALVLLGLATMFALPAWGASALLTITPPSSGLTTSTGTFTPTIQLSGDADPSKLKVFLGSQDVTSLFNPGSCFKAPCTLTGTLGFGAGLRYNWNLLHASVTGPSGAADVQRLRFYVSGGLGDPSDGSGLPHQVKVTQTVSEDTSYTTLTIWTPTPQTYQSCDSDQSTNLVQIIDLNRTTLQKRDSRCLSSDQVAAYLQNLDESDLVFGLQSVWGATKADFTGIGGGNYSGDSDPGQFNYSIVGYGKAAKGAAFEVLTSKNYHGINGNLVNITCANVPTCGTNNNSNTQLFSFQPGNNQAFSIVPGAAGNAGNPGIPKIYVGNVQTIPFGGSSNTPPNQVLPTNSVTGQPLFRSTTYTPTWTDPSAAGGFWLLTLNRSDLTLISSQVFVTNCACTDEASENSAMSALYVALITPPISVGPDNDRLQLLTTVGVPFGTAGNPSGFITGMNSSYGISPYAIQGLVADQFGTPARAGFSMVIYTPNTSDSRFYSTSANVQQGETGGLRGVFAQNHTQFYEAINVAPFNITDLPYDATADDFLRHGTSSAIGSTAPVPWPQMDTLAKQNAYSWLSNKIVTYISCSGAANCECGFDVQSCHDVRSFYTTDQVTSVYKLQPTTITYPGDGNGFGNDEFTTVQNQLALESAALTNVNNYRTYMENLNLDASANVALALTTGANEVSVQLNQALPNPEMPTGESAVHLTADIFNAAAGALSVPGVAFPPVGMAAGVVWTVSAILGTVDDAQKTDPQPDPYVVQLEDLISGDNKVAAEKAALFNKNLTSATDLYFDGIFSDWFRLQTVGLLSTSSGAEGWFVADSAASPAGYIAGLTASVRTSLYRQTIPQYFLSMPFLGVASLYWETKNNITNNGIMENIVSYYMGSWFQTGGFNTGGPTYGPYLLPQDIHNYTWNNRTALGQNSYCEDYIFFVSGGKDPTKGKPWGDDFGNALFGPPNASTGLGNLNLDRNWIYDASGIPFFPKTAQNPSAPWDVIDTQFVSWEPIEYYNCGKYPQPWNFNEKQPSFSNLASHTIPELTETVTLSGYIKAGTSIPPGSVNITIADQTNSTAIQSDGSFSYTWTTRSMPASKVPYVVEYSYGGSSGYLRATDTTTTLTVVSTEVNVTLTASPSSPGYGDSVSLAVALESPAGTPDAATVTFYSDGVEIGTAQSSGNQAMLNTNAFTVGQHQLYAVYAGAGLYKQGTSPAITVNIGKGAPNLTPQVVQAILAGAGPTQLQGSVTKSGSTTPTGTATATINGVTSQPPVTLGGDGSFTIPFDTSGLPWSATPYPITYQYSGDTHYNTESNGSTTLTVNPNTSATMLKSTSAYGIDGASLEGQEVTFTATVTGSKGIPSRSVVFKDGDATLGTEQVDTTGTATYKTSSLTHGTHNITANYSGDNLYGVSSAVLTQYVSIVAKFSQITSQSDYVGAQTHTFSGVLSGAGPTYPTGSQVVVVTVAPNTNNQTVAFKQPNADGSFSISVDVSKLPVGQYAVEYYWGGDGVLGITEDTTTIFSVNANASTTALSSSSAYEIPNASLVGQEVTFTATVTGSKGTPSGSVVFKDGNTTLVTVPVDTANGTATYKTSSLTQGAHNITASYSGDSVYAVSSAALSQYVVIAASFSQITSQSDYLGAQTHTFTGVVSGAGPTYPTGSQVALVTVDPGGANQTSAFHQPNADGSFSIPVDISKLPVGQYKVEYYYGGNGILSIADDTTTTLSVLAPGATATSLISSLNPSPQGQNVTFTATVTSGNGIPQGTVNFMDGTTTLSSNVPIDPTKGTATYQTNSLSYGTPHSITAIYNGGLGFIGSTSPALTQNVQLSTVVYNTGNPDPSIYGLLTAYIAGQIAGEDGGTVADYPTGQTLKITIGKVSQLVTMRNLGMFSTEFPTMGLAVGTYPIQIDYAGDSKFAAMSDKSLQLTINQGTPAFSGLTPSQTIDGGTASVNLSGVISAPLFLNNYVLQFTATNSDGQGGVNLPYDTTGVSTDSATYSLWIKTSVTTEQVLFTMSNFYPYLRLKNDQLELEWDGTGPNWVSADTTPVSDGRWHHIAVTYDQGKITFYKDGIATNDNFAATTPGTSGSPFNLGGSIEGAPSFLGEMWNAKIWSKALSAAEILADRFATYNGGAVPDGLKFASVFDSITNTATNIVNGETATPQVGAAAAVDTLPAIAPAINGKVTISVNGVDTNAPIGANGYFTGSIDTSKLAAKSYPITYKFGGDANFNAAPDDSSTTLTVQSNSTITTVISSVNPAVFGTPVTFTANVTSGTAKPSGTVTFMDGTTQLGDPVTIDTTTGTAIYQTSALSVGPHNITGTYNGNSDYSKSTSPVLTQTIQGFATTTSMTTSASPATYGSYVTFTATVSSGSGTPTGTVTFYDGTTALSLPVNLNNGQASYQTNSLALGPHSIKASYDGSGTNFANSDSAVLTQTIQAIFTLTTVSSSANPAAFGASVTFTAQVASANGTPTGTVTIYDGTTALGPSVNVVNGQAIYQTSSLSTGPHSIKASFDGGTSGFGKSDSAVLTQTIQSTSTSTALTSSANPATFGTSVTFTATVTSGLGIPVGSVTFMDGTTQLGNAVALDNTGKATYQTNALSAGQHNITANYSGSGYSSSSAALVQSVVMPAAFSQLGVNLPQGTTTATFTGVLSGAGPTYPDGTHLVLVTVAPSQTYQLQGSGKPNSDGTFKVTLDVSSLAAETYAVRFDYSGDSKLSSATDSSAQLVIPSSGPVVVQVFMTATPNPSVAGDTVTFTATVPQIGNDMPTGNVTISEPLGPNNVLIYGNNDLVNGVATIVVDSSSAQQLSAGRHTIFATFGSLDPVYKPGATSNPYTMVVNQAEEVQHELKSLVYGLTQGSPLPRNNFDGFAGMQFTVGSNPMSVSFLGRMCSEGNSQTHTVKIVSASTNNDVPGALTTVNMANCTPGQPVYASLATAVSLTPGTTYYLVSQERRGGDSFYEHGRISTASDIARIKPAYFNGTNWIALDSPGEAYVLADMGYEVLPELSSTAFVLDYNGNDRALRNNFSGFVGMSFTTGTEALQVSSLGRACVANSSQAHLVKLVNAATGAADVPGGSASVDMNGCTISQFVYADLSAPLTLQANTTYYLVSQETIGGDKWYDQGTITTTDKAIVTDAIFSNGNGWAKQPGRNNSYGPVNFRYSTDVR